MDILNFRDVDWGADEAKGDRNLVKYFLKIPEFDGILDGKYRYIIGRKGTGKTAVIERIREEVETNHMWQGVSLSLRDFPLALIRKLRDKSFQDKSQFVPVWKFLMLVEICKFVGMDETAVPLQDVLDLRDFVKNNFPQEFTFTDTLTYLDKQDSKVSIASKLLGISTGAEQSVQTTEHVHFQKASQVILAKLRKLSSECTFFLFFDELDEGYRAGDKNQRLLLLSLLRSVEDTFMDFDFTGLKIRPVLALRSDIFDSLEDNDLNKLDDYIVRLNWYSNKDGDYSLRSLVDARIAASLPMLPFDGWQVIVKDHDNSLPGKNKSVWSYIASRTFERPRDIVKFLKFIKKHSPAGKLKFNTIDNAEIEYSNWFYNELRDEIHSHLPVWKEALQALTKIGKGIFPYSELEVKLLQDKAISNYIENNSLSVDDIIEKLFEFSVLGNLDRRRWLFKYKDFDMPFDKNMDLIVHFGFGRKFRFPKRMRIWS